MLVSAELAILQSIPPPGLAGTDDSLTGLTAAADGQSVYLVVAQSAGGALVRAGRRRGAPVERWSLAPSRPLFVSYAPDASLVLVGAKAPPENGVLLLLPPRPLAPATTLVVCSGEPRGGAVHPDGHRVYVTCSTGEIAEIDLDLGAVLRTVSYPPDGAPGSCQPTPPALSSNGTVLFVACARTGGLHFLDRVTLTAFDSLAVGEGAVDLVVAGARRVVLVRTAHNEIVVADPRGRSVVARLATPAPARVAVSADHRWAYAVGGGGSETAQLVRIDLRTGRIAAVVPVPVGARHVALWPERTPVMRWR